MQVMTLLLLPFVAEAQAPTAMINGDTLFLTRCNGSVSFCDDGGPNDNYSNNFEGWIVIHVNPGESITVTGNYNIESGFDFIRIFDEGNLIAVKSGVGTINSTVTSGTMRIQFYSDASTTRDGFVLYISTSHGYAPCSAIINGPIVSNINTTSALISWTTDADTLMLTYGNNRIAVTGESIHLIGLDTNTAYNLRLYHPADSNEVCCTHTTRFSTAAGASHGCIDPTDLHGNFVTAYNGSYGDPYLSIGLVDYGPSDPNSRHTIHTDTNERDINTGNQLRTIPSGATASVRLGDYRADSQAEALLYAIEVDTNLYDLLLLRYAAVLQNPSHLDSEQPRFRLELLNSTMELLDSTCGAVDFIASSELGWNLYNETLWKDWTSVGIDLTPYSGQIIFVRLSTYDCPYGGHFGYAYFTLECGNKRMETSGCGNVDTIAFIAPDGFNYLWYNDSPLFPTSTARTLEINSSANSTYHCKLSFIDNPTCYFNMDAYAGIRYPLSLFDNTITVNNCEFDVNFINRSTISTDGINPIGTGERCETAWWDFGNGQTSTQHNPSIHYNHPGDYVVTLVSSIADGTCIDTLQTTIHLTSQTEPPTLIGPNQRCSGTPADTIFLRHAVSSTWTSDTLLVTPDTTTTYYVTAFDTGGCAYDINHTINVNPSFNIVYNDYICDDTNIDFYGNNLNTSGIYFHQTITSQGCDSAIMLVLNVLTTPTADFHYEPDLIAIHNSVIQLFNTSTPDSIAFLWEIERKPGGEIDTTSAFELTYEWNPDGVNDIGDYHITLNAIWTHSIDDTNITCIDTTSRTVTLVNDYLEFPNLVTPNGDGINDIWKVANLLEYRYYKTNELWIFNKWGTPVYHIKNINSEEDFWDPNLSASPDGTYYYSFSAISQWGPLRRNGAIEVIRQ